MVVTKSPLDSCLSVEEPPNAEDLLKRIIFTENVNSYAIVSVVRKYVK